MLSIACGALVDLGPEAIPRDAGRDETAGVAEGSPIDTALPDGDSDAPDEGGYTCGLQPSPNAMCSDCAHQHCCDFTRACASNPQCVTGADKLMNCAYDISCIDDVESKYADAGLGLIRMCVIQFCLVPCLPKGPNCGGLATCCQWISDAQSALRQTCTVAANNLDEHQCENTLDNVLRPQLGARFCAQGADAAGE